MTQAADAAAVAAVAMLLLQLLLAGCLGIAHLSHFPVGAGQARLPTVALFQATTIRRGMQHPAHNTDDTQGKCMTSAKAKFNNCSHMQNSFRTDYKLHSNAEKMNSSALAAKLKKKKFALNYMLVLLMAYIYTATKLALNFI